MRCEHCNQNEATTYIKQNINGKVTEMHLCRDCAEKLGVLEPMHSNMGLGSMFEGSFFGNFLGAGLAVNLPHYAVPQPGQSFLSFQ